MITLLTIIGFIISMILVSYVLSQTIFKNYPGCSGNCCQGRRSCDCRGEK